MIQADARWQEGDILVRLALQAAAQVLDRHAESWRAAERDLIARHGPNNPTAVDAQARGQTWASAAETLRAIAGATGCPACNWMMAIDAGEVEAYRRGDEIRQRADGELACQRCGRVIT